MTVSVANQPKGRTFPVKAYCFNHKKALELNITDPADIKSESVTDETQGRTFDHEYVTCPTCGCKVTVTK